MLPPTVIIGDPNYRENPYKHQGAYAIRRDPQPLPPPQQQSQQPQQLEQPRQDLATTLITENIKKSYERQQLPVRNQSLAAAATAVVAANAVARHVQQAAAARHPSNSSEHSSRSDSSCATSSPGASPPIRRSSLTRPKSPYQQRTTSPNSSPLTFSHASSYPTPGRSSSSLDGLTTDDDGFDDDDDDDDYDDDDDIEDEGIYEHEAVIKSGSNLSIGTAQIQQKVVSPMAYETDDQQSAFFSHYTSTPKNENRHLLLDADFDCALLSHVCREIHGYIMPSTLVQDSVEYHNTFTGKYVVDCLRNILQANGKNDDRSRALILGRALLFQDVIQDIYGERKLRDADNHLYRFTQHYISTSCKSDELDSVTAVVTPLTSCYSPTCSIHQPCYSYNCPSKVSQTLKRSASQASLPDKENTRELWILSVPRDVIAATSPDERKRQECIYELIYTEEDYAKDLQYVHNHWIEPLLASDTIITPSERKERVVHQIFWNIIEIEMMSTALSMTLIQRRKEQDVVDTIGDVLLSFVSQFDPYVSYGSHQLVGKHYFELEKKRNPRFKQFVEETERKAESRRLELNGYLTKPTTRLGRYNLLLREILKRTPKGNPDRETLPKVMDIIARFLRYVNRETGNVENAFNLQQLEHRLTFKSSSIAVDLNLNDPKRTLVMKGRMKRKGNSSSDASDVQVLLFDHYLVFAKIKFQNHLEYYKVFRKPIPLDQLSLSVVDPQQQQRTGINSRLPGTTMRLGQSSSATTNDASPSRRPSNADDVGGYGIIFYHHGRGGSSPVTLYNSSMANRELWVEKILGQKEIFAIQQCHQQTATGLRIDTRQQHNILTAAPTWVSGTPTSAISTTSATTH